MPDTRLMRRRPLERPKRKFAIERLETRDLFADLGFSVSSDHGDRVVPGTVVRFTVGGNDSQQLQDIAFRIRGEKEEWRDARPYSESLTWSWNTSNIPEDVYYVGAFLRASGSSASYDIALTPVAIVVTSQSPVSGVSITTTVNTAPIGKVVQFAASAVGGSGAYEYRFVERSGNSEWKVGQEYSQQSTYDLLTFEKEVGEYVVGVFARSLNSPAVYEAAGVPVSIILTEHIAPEKAEIALLGADRIAPGAMVPFEGTVIGGNADYEYEFRVRTPSTEWKTARAYSLDRTWLLMAPSVDWEQFYVCIWARTRGSNAGFELASAPAVIVVTNYLPAQSVSVATPDSLRGGVRGFYRFSASAVASNAVEYAFLVRSKHGDWQKLRDYSPDPNWIWNASAQATDLYYVTALARTAGSKAEYEAFAPPLTVVITTVPAATGLALTFDSEISARVGEFAELSAIGVGGTGNYEYQFKRKKGDDWVIERGYSDNPRWGWVPSEEEVGEHWIEIAVRTLGSPVEFDVIKVVRIQVRESVDQLWTRLFVPYLATDLWRPQYVEDASHSMLVPLESAFQDESRDEWRLAFSNLFQRFLVSAERIETELYRLEFYYLASRFVRLAVEHGHPELIPSGLTEELASEVSKRWELEPAWMWDSPSFQGGIRERILAKLAMSDPRYSYYPAIVDHDMFVIGIAAELATYERMIGASVSSIYLDVLNVTRKMLDARIEWQPNGGWLFQPGIWRDHPEYAYAGHMKAAAGLLPLERENVSEDSSHSFRWPVWIDSLIAAQSVGSDGFAYYELLLRGLARQFESKVLVHPTYDFPGFRLNNYMDGYNGVYRYEYYTAGANRGYDSFQLSGSLYLGLWSFLQSDLTTVAYTQMSERFPLADSQLVTYVGPNTSRVRHPLETWPAAFTNGNYELHVLLASQL